MDILGAGNQVEVAVDKADTGQCVRANSWELFSCLLTKHFSKVIGNNIKEKLKILSVNQRIKWHSKNPYVNYLTNFVLVPQ